MKKRGILIISIVFSALFIDIVLASHWTLDLNQDLKAYYKLDETSSGVVINSVSDDWEGINEGAIVGEPGIIGTSYEFDGDGDYIYLDPDLYNEETLTLSFWIKKQGNWDNLDYLWNCGDGSDPHIHSFYIAGEGLRFAGCGSKPTFALYTYVTPSLGSWHHIVLQFTEVENGQARIWIDGELISTDNSVSDCHGDSAHTNTFGDSLEVTANAFNGFIDEIAWWDRYLSEDEIAQLYNKGNGITYALEDSDNDTMPDFYDNCLLIPNPNQEDIDLDKVGDVCDNCVYNYNPSQTDLNNNSVGEACEFETRISALESWKETTDNWKEEIVETITDIWDAITGLVSFQGDAEDALDDHETRISILESQSGNSLNQTFPDYLNYLSSSDRKKIVCGYAEDNRLEHIEELDWICNLTYKTYRGGRERVSCKCKKS